MENKKIKVVDSIMGAGKTSYAIQMMNQSAGDISRRFLYIAPFLDEVDRIIEKCPKLDFQQPQKRDRYSTKSEDLFNLIAEGHNIASTHSLFKLLDMETIELLRVNGYTLVLDEVIDVIEPIRMKEEKLAALFNREILKEGETVGDKTLKVEAGPESRLDEYEEYRKMARLGRLIKFENKVLMWLFPADVFKAFDDVYVLTYMFAGQSQKCFYDMHGLEYDYYSVRRVEGSGPRRYELIPYDHNIDKLARSEFLDLVNIYEGHLNAIGNRRGSFSVSWYSNIKPALKTTIKNAVYNFFRNQIGGKSTLNMWTTYDANRNDLNGNGYARGFVACNARATNKYHEKANLAFLCNWHLNPYVKKYFISQGVEPDEDIYALSMLIQWIWRSRIRDKDSINLYIPSKRMRCLLKDWLNVWCETTLLMKAA